jgi:signal transduction histidine kinase
LASESFRHTGVYVLVFVGSMAVMIVLVFAVVDQGFKASLLRASTDDLRAIKEAYVEGKPRGRGIHEAREMIEDRTLASDVQNRFLLQSAGAGKLAGNMPAMQPKPGIFYLPYPLSAVAAAQPGHQVLGCGEFIAPGIYAFVGRDLYEVRRSERDILLIFLGVLGASVLLAGLSGLWLSRRYLRRIDSISDTCRAIMAGRLGDRIPAQDAGGELNRLAATINGMLDRIQLLMESLRQVSNDIAHDLRTPLAHLRFSLEKVISEGRSKEDFERAAQHAIVEADQLLDMFSALLRIARIESGARRTAFEAFDLGELLTQAFSMYAPLFEDAERPAAVTAPPGLLVLGDRQLILQMITNLLDNAIHHTPAGTRVTGKAEIHGACPHIEIADTGPGVPEADRGRIFRRFFRLEKSRTTPGHGLGLSIVSAIAELHDAQITLSDNGPGLRVGITFPAPRPLPKKRASTGSSVNLPAKA